MPKSRPEVSDKERSSWYIVIEHPDEIRPRTRASKGFTYNMINETDTPALKQAIQVGNPNDNEVHDAKVKASMPAEGQGERHIENTQQGQCHHQTCIGRHEKKQQKVKRSETGRSEIHKTKENQTKDNNSPFQETGKVLKVLQQNNIKEELLPKIAEAGVGNHDQRMTVLKRPRIDNRRRMGPELCLDCSHSDSNPEIKHDSDLKSGCQDNVAVSESDTVTKGKAQKVYRAQEPRSTKHKHKHSDVTAGASPCSHMKQPKSNLEKKKASALANAMKKYECEDSDCESVSDTDEENVDVLQMYKKMKLRILL